MQQPSIFTFAASAPDAEAPVTIGSVRTMLEFFPLDGLRKAAETFGLPLPPRTAPKAAQTAALVAALSAGLLARTLAYRERPVPAEDALGMWKEAYAYASPPVIVGGETAPSLTDAVRAEIAALLHRILNDLGGAARISKICAGKVSSATQHAERSAYLKRIRDRYGKPAHKYDVMRRIWADRTSSGDIATREATALLVEAFLFQQLRLYFGAAAEGMIEFSDAAGRRVSKTKAQKPEWAVFVYLVVKLNKV